MAITIGVYDSGIGGLTTLAALRAYLPRCDFYYLSDNASMPFGTKKRDEVSRIVNSGVEKLRHRCDLTVIACNTASVAVNPANCFKLRPTLAPFAEEDTTLIMATPATLSALEVKTAMRADTACLAGLIERVAERDFSTGAALDMSPLSEYLKQRTMSFAEKTKRIILGCSHYGYIKPQLQRIFPEAFITDNNLELALRVADFIGGSPNENSKNIPKVSYDFTGIDETEKYEWISKNLQKALLFRN